MFLNFRKTVKFTEFWVVVGRFWWEMCSAYIGFQKLQSLFKLVLVFDLADGLEVFCHMIIYYYYFLISATAKILWENSLSPGSFPICSQRTQVNKRPWLQWDLDLAFKNVGWREGRKFQHWVLQNILITESLVSQATVLFCFVFYYYRLVLPKTV